MWHQPCQRCKYTTSVDIQKRAIKSYSLTQNRRRASESDREWRIELCESDQQKHVYSDLLYALKGEHLSALGSQQRGP